MLKGRKLAIATKHQKETVLAPLLEKHLGVACFLPFGLDTDTLGTFTGEVTRTLDPLAAARAKCHLAMELTGCDLAVASEGSFGPHPTLFFLPADDEVLLFLDRKNQLEIAVREVSTETNYAQEWLSTEEQLADFAQRARFPSHALILRPSPQRTDGMVKGIQEWAELVRVFRQLKSQDHQLYIETDMRAMYNPTRLSVIAQVGRKLVQRLGTHCPSCQTPGFGITDSRSGLPCGGCGTPTRSTLSYLHSCQRCGFSEEQKYPHQKQYEDPMYCDYCNP
jgi:hypothetical protein